MPPIEYDIGYRSRTPTLTLKLTLTLTLKVTIMYAVQNDTGIKFNIVLYMCYFPRAGGGGVLRRSIIIIKIIIIIQRQLVRRRNIHNHKQGLLTI